MKVGDRVRFKAEWLRNTGQFTGPVPFARGVVVDIGPFGNPEESDRAVVTVEWRTEGMPERSKALDVNLEVCR